MTRWTLSLLLFITSLLTPCNKTNAQERDFYVMTIPKSGTYLLLKALVMLTEKEFDLPYIPFPELSTYLFPSFTSEQQQVLSKNFETTLMLWKEQQKFPLTHFNFTECFSDFSKLHPEFVPIINIRDLRDACVSCAYFQWNDIENEIGPSTMEQKLYFLITLGDRDTRFPILNIYRNAKIAAKWMKKPSVVTVRFEELVGRKGGGSEVEQKLVLYRLAEALNIYPSEMLFQWIEQELFGTESGPQFLTTFRQGMIGTWKQHFTPALHQAFVEHMGTLQLELGYPLN